MFQFSTHATFLISNAPMFIRRLTINIVDLHSEAQKRARPGYHDDSHARFDATARTYKYFVHTRKSPFLYPFSWRATSKLDFELMNEAAEKLYDFTDFTSFSKLHTDVKTNNCKITYARWEREGEQWVFTITADRFLRNMVRAIVGTLVDVGRGKITVEQFCEIIEKKNRCSAGTSMPGNALFLWHVSYPYINN